MMRTIFTSFLITAALSGNLHFAQNHISVHQADKIRYGKVSVENMIEEPDGIIPLQFDKSAQTGKVVFGFLPYWEYPGALSNIKYDLLTHIAAFDFQVDSLGNITNPSGWPWTNLINQAHTAGVKMILTAVNFAPASIHSLITKDSAKNNFFAKLTNLINTYSFDGVNVDFEALYVADRGTAINNFMASLTQYIHTNHPGKEVSFAGPAVNWSGWQLPGLAAACDYIFIMGYDFAGSFSTVTAPPAPLTGGTYNITNTVNVQYGGCPPEKLVLGVPYFGAEWVANSNQVGATISSFVASPRFASAMAQSQNYGLQWHAASQTAYYIIPVNNNQFNQVWFDDDRATGLKYTFAKNKNLKGIGMWALNYDRERPELWAEITKYLAPQSVETEISLPEKLLLSAYPNPFNPATTLEYQLPTAGNVTLTVYDISGKEVLRKEAGFHPAGSVTEKLSLNSFPSGVYLVRLSLVNETCETAGNLKVLLMK